MSNLLKSEVELLIENYSRLDEEFPWEEPILKHLISVMNSLKCKRVDCKNIKGIRTFINKNINLFSNIRGINSLLVSASIGSDDGGVNEAKYILDIYNKLKKIGMRENNYLSIVAYILSLNDDEFHRKERIEKYKLLYDDLIKLKGMDSMLISGLALREDEVKTIENDIYKCISNLKSKENKEDRNICKIASVLNLSSGNIEKKCENVINMYKVVKRDSNLFNKENIELITILSNVDKSPEEVLEESNYVIEQLKEYSEFKEWKVSKRITNLIALTLVADYNMRKCNDKDLVSLFSNNINLVKISLEPNIINSLNLFTL